MFHSILYIILQFHYSFTIAAAFIAHAHQPLRKLNKIKSMQLKTSNRKHIKGTENGAISYLT